MEELIFLITFIFRKRLIPTLCPLCAKYTRNAHRTFTRADQRTFRIFGHFLNLIPGGGLDFKKTSVDLDPP